MILGILNFIKVHDEIKLTQLSNEIVIDSTEALVHDEIKLTQLSNLQR